MKNFKLACCIFFAVALLGCSRTFIVVPSGNVEEGLVFTFFDNKSDVEPSSFLIAEIYVQRLDNEIGWVTIWELKGKGELSVVRYGHSYDGLSEVVSPAELQINNKYRVLATEISVANPEGFGGNEFFINENGLVELVL